MLANYTLYMQPEQIVPHLPSDKTACKLLKSEAAAYFKSQRLKTGFLCAIQIKHSQPDPTNIYIIKCPKCNHAFETSYAKELDPEYALEVSTLAFYCRNIPSFKPLIDAIAKDLNPLQDKIDAVINAIGSELYLHSKKANLLTSASLINSLNSSAQECFAPQRLNTVNSNVMKCSIVSGLPNAWYESSNAISIQACPKSSKNIAGISVDSIKNPTKKTQQTPTKAYIWDWNSEGKCSKSYMQSYDDARRRMQIEFSKHKGRK